MMSRRLLTFLLLFFLFIQAGVGFTQSGRLRVVYVVDGRLSYVSTVTRDGVIYASIESLGDVLGLKGFYNASKKKYVLRSGSRAIKITGMNPFIIVDDVAYQMALPTILHRDEVYVPIALFIQITDDLLPGEVEYDKYSETLRILSQAFNVTGIEVEEKANGTLVRFITTKNFSESDVAASVNRRWLNVTLNGGKLDSARIASDQQMGIVKQILPFQFEGSVQVSFLLDRNIKNPDVYVDEGEVLVTLRTEGGAPSPITQLDDAARNRWLIDRIILDPGHGGHDPGAISPNGVMEKEINLDIAKRLRSLLIERLKVDVLMTRTDDRYVRIKERTQFANSSEGDLFISIHCNSNESPRPRGFSTYILGTRGNDEALSVAEKENSVVKLEESPEQYENMLTAVHILNAIAQYQHLKESQDLAQSVNEAMADLTRLSRWGRGIYQGVFYVLIGAAMPRVLVETAFLSNTSDEKYLRTRAYRQKIAEALFQGVKRFKERYEADIGLR